MTREPETARRRGQPTEVLSVIGISGDPTLVPGMLSLDEGRWLRNPADVVIGKTLARDKGLKIGDLLRLNGSSSTIVGIGKLRGFTAFGQEGVAYMDYKTLVQRVQLANNVFNVIAIQTKRPEAVSARLADLGGVSTWTPAQLVAESQQAFASSIAIDWVLILMTLGIAGLFVSTLLNHSVSERRAEFAVLRAIGLPAWWVVMTVALEAVAVTVAAGLLGVGISFLLGVLLNVTVAAQFGIESLYRVDPQLFLVIFVLANGLGVISGVLPARKAASVDPVEVLREV
jgi:lipoprotein-releasing system permease protein